LGNSVGGDAGGRATAASARRNKWLDALPEATLDSPTGQALQAIIDLDLNEIAGVEPPRGFGRD
jgi:hypothetical protein